MFTSGKKLALAAILGTSATLGLSKAASADVLHFDDITVADPSAGEFVPNTYHGFTTTNGAGDPSFFVENDADFAGPTNISGTGGYGNTFGAPSDPNAASNDGGVVLTHLGSPTLFNLVSIDLASFGSEDGFDPTSARTLTIIGTLGGVAVPGATSTVTLDPAAYHTTALNFNNIDGIDFVAAGSLDPDNAPGGYFLMDNIQYTAVPEPASLSLLGLGGLALIRRRRMA